MTSYISPVTGTITDESNIEDVKLRIAQLLSMGDTIMFEIARLVRHIDEDRLYMQEVNQETGEKFKSMTEYFPFLLDELKTRAKLHKLSVRQVREYMALDRVLIQNLGIPKETLMLIGPGNATEIREALAYDRRTGEIMDEPPLGKIGREKALEVIDMIVDSDGEWRVQDTRALLDEERGVNRKTLKVNWELHPLRESGVRRYRIVDVIQIKEGLVTSMDMTGFTLEEAQEIVKSLGATTNLGDMWGVD